MFVDNSYLQMTSLFLFPGRPAVSIIMARSFKRRFDKRHYPLLGEDLDTPVNQDDMVHLRGRKHAAKPLSVSVQRIYDLLVDPVTGKWKWPVNDADEVYPGILLGDG